MCNCPVGQQQVHLDSSVAVAVVVLVRQEQKAATITRTRRAATCVCVSKCFLFARKPPEQQQSAGISFYSDIYRLISFFSPSIRHDFILSQSRQVAVGLICTRERQRRPRRRRKERPPRQLNCQLVVLLRRRRLATDFTLD